MEIRLQKFLALAGVASRRKAEELITNGKIKVNSQVVTALGTKIDPSSDVVEYNNKKIIHKEDKVYYMLHKPVGYITSVKDEKNRKTVIDLLKTVPERIYPVGRLDYDTSGLLILTNDGELTYRITHPKYEVAKIYEAKINGIPTPNELEQFENGLMIEGRKTAKAKIHILKTSVNSSIVSITITEGRNRQVRKMCDAIGHPVINLKRVAIGKLNIASLSVGKYRPLTAQEIKYLKSL